MGIDVLLDEHRVIDYHGSKIIMAGITDHSAPGFIKEHTSDPKKALAGAPAADLKILLAHQPVSAYKTDGLGYHLQLSGHTHGGQYIPYNKVIKLVQPFVKGLYNYKGMWVYVNRGTGYWGPPMRAGVPSEITAVRFKSA